MKHLKSTLSNLRHIFSRTIVVRDIAEPLICFDRGQAADEIRTFMVERGYDVVGVRDKGVVVGYAIRTELKDATVGAYCREFAADQIMTDCDPLVEAFKVLQNRRYVFVNILGHVGGIVTRGDLQKAPVRLWLFGLVSLTEMQMLRILKERFPSDSWQKLLSEKRLAGARRIFEERCKRNEETGLSDCLQICDKAEILMNAQDLAGLIGFDSKRSGDEFFRFVGGLRDALAHSNNFSHGDWTELHKMVQRLEATLERLEKITVKPLCELKPEK